MKAYTTIEESKQLIKAGLDINTADMYYEEIYLDKKSNACYITPPKMGKSKFIKPKQNLPCWSLAALLSILTENNITYSLCNHILFENTIEEGIMAYKQDECNMEHYTVNKTVIEAIIKFLEYGFIKKAKEGLNYDIP